MNETVRADVASALREEAFSSVLHRLFEDRARSDGREELAALFRGTAQVELGEHCAALAELAGLVGTPDENLEDAIVRNEAAIERYDRLAAAARVAGEAAVAERFAALADARRIHALSFEQALEALVAPA